MTAITDTKAILETLAGKTLSASVLTRVVENIINYNAVQGLTNEEKADIFITNLRNTIRSTMRSHAEQKQRATDAAAAVTAGDTALADL